MNSLTKVSAPEGRPLGITEVVLRDAHQSLLATRLRLDDMLPIAAKLDQVGYWSLESWGGATFDACIRYLGEDPWDRLREFKAAMPNTPQQMLLRGQNLLGYRHYADDVVKKFVERAAVNGVDVFRIFDALNDPRNMATAIQAVQDQGKHAQGTLAYTVSPVHNLQYWLELARRLEDMGVHSLCIKDMAGLLTPYAGFELVAELKKAVDLPIHMQCHATTGLSSSTYLKCIEAGVDNIDTAISSMSQTYGHSPTESLVAMLRGTGRDTGHNMALLEQIAVYFRDVRKKYACFEGELRGIDARILVAQVPGGMLTNLESQLKEQSARDKLDEVLAEIPSVRRDLGYIPLVTPTSQIVGTQAVLNVLAGARYETLTRETVGLLRGEYGATPVPVDANLQRRALQGDEPVTCRPADLLAPEMDDLSAVPEVGNKSLLRQGSGRVEDILTCVLFPLVGRRFLENRGNPDAFEPIPTGNESALDSAAGESVYTLTLDGVDYTVVVNSGGDISAVGPVMHRAAPQGVQPSVREGGNGESVTAPLSGAVVKVLVEPDQRVSSGEPLLVMEAMKMENTVKAPHDGLVTDLRVEEGDSVQAGDRLLSLVVR